MGLVGHSAALPCGMAARTMPASATTKDVNLLMLFP
jgi:hypothetical protein